MSPSWHRYGTGRPPPVPLSQRYNVMASASQISCRPRLMTYGANFISHSLRPMTLSRWGNEDTVGSLPVVTYGGVLPFWSLIAWHLYKFSHTTDKGFSFPYSLARCLPPSAVITIIVKAGQSHLPTLTVFLWHPTYHVGRFADYMSSALCNAEVARYPQSCFHRSVWLALWFTPVYFCLPADLLIARWHSRGVFVESRNCSAVSLSNLSTANECSQFVIRRSFRCRIFQRNGETNVRNLLSHLHRHLAKHISPLFYNFDCQMWLN